MTPMIRWQVFLRAKTRDKAEKVLRRFMAALDLQSTVTACDPYWKDPTLYQARLTSALPESEPAAATFATLRAGSKLARSWIVGGPQEYDGGRWELSGTAVCGTITLTGVAELDFCVSNIQEETAVQAPREMAVPSTER